MKNIIEVKIRCFRKKKTPLISLISSTSDKKKYIYMYNVLTLKI